jgi:hypothetical protein
MSTATTAPDMRMHRRQIRRFAMVFESSAHVSEARGYVHDTRRTISRNAPHWSDSGRSCATATAPDACAFRRQLRPSATAPQACDRVYGSRGKVRYPRAGPSTSADKRHEPGSYRAAATAPAMRGLLRLVRGLEETFRVNRSDLRPREDTRDKSDGARLQAQALQSTTSAAYSAASRGCLAAFIGNNDTPAYQQQYLQLPRHHVQQTRPNVRRPRTLMTYSQHAITSNSERRDTNTGN